MTWDHALLKLADSDDDELVRLLELASEWHVKAISFARFRQRKMMDDALDKCQRALDLAAKHAQVEPPEVIDREYFWQEFSAPEIPGPGGNQNSPNAPARVPRKPLPSSGSAAVALPLPEPEDDDEA